MMSLILDGQIGPDELVRYLELLAAKGVSVDELAGSARALDASSWRAERSVRRDGHLRHGRRPIGDVQYLHRCGVRHRRRRTTSR